VLAAVAGALAAVEFGQNAQATFGSFIVYPKWREIKNSDIFSAKPPKSAMRAARGVALLP
jgi:hypothetical protein